MNTSKSLDQILNELVVPWDTSDLPPNVRITSPSLKIAQAKAAIVEAVEGLIGENEFGNIGYDGEEMVDETTEEMFIRNQFRVELRQAIKEWQ